MINPLRSHWLRVSLLLLLASPIVAVAVAATSGVPVVITLLVTLYMWAGVCVILAVVALGGLIVRLARRGVRALRR